MDQDTKDILDAVNFVKQKVEQLPTNDEIRAIVEEVVDEKLAPTVAELGSIRRELKDLATKVEDVIGYRKEIDHALERIAAIEKHLGIGRKIAA